MSPKIKISNTNIGLDYPTYFIADIAANHDGDIERAKDLIYMSAESGANAAKFQNFQASTIVSDYGFKNMKGKTSHQSSWTKSVFDIYKDASIPIEWSSILKEVCDEAGIHYMTSPYDLKYIDQLSEYVCAWKLGSGDITWHEMIEKMSKDEKPLIMATGASDMEEVIMAVEVANKNSEDIILMQCNTNYTASIENFKYISLKVLKLYAEIFPNLVLGLSDHTHGHSTVLGAVTLGARAIEKHFTDDCSRAGPDHKFSMSPSSWKDMVHATRELESAFGQSEKKVMDNEKETIIVQRRSLRAKESMKAGDVINRENVVELRPCSKNSLPPYKINRILGKTLVNDINEGACIFIDDIKK
jgi:sialic acid synthase SpsE